jgi:hypothetical protein
MKYWIRTKNKKIKIMKTKIEMKGNKKGMKIMKRENKRERRRVVR